MEGGHRTANATAYPSSLETAEAKLVVQRRTALTRQGEQSRAPRILTEGPAKTSASPLGRLNEILQSRRRETVADSEALAADVSETAPMPLPDNTIGFGLSGGGIRSATFALGLFQALARSRLVRKIDFLSTVSGGGYFGAFLGRLFTRPWVQNADDVERVLQGIDPKCVPEAETGWGRRAFHWLRDNGRYLAPRGSGDLLMLGSILLRNWVAVQVVLVTTVLTLFVGLQLARIALEHILGLTNSSVIADILACRLPGSNFLWLSPWLVVALVPLALLVVPAGWSYWIVTRKYEGRQGIPPYVGLLATCGFGIAGTLYYRSEIFGHSGWFTALLSSIPSYSRPEPHPERLMASLAAFFVSALALLFWIVGEFSVSQSENRTDGANLLRNALTRLLKTGLVLTGVVLAWSIVDSLGITIYQWSHVADHSLTHWALGLSSAFAGIGAFGRQLTVLLAPSKQGARRGIPVSMLSWVAAVIVGVIWVLAINVGSHAIAWEFKPPQGVPPQLTADAKQVPPTLFGADYLVVGSGADGLQVRAARTAPTKCVVAPPLTRDGYGFALAAFVILALLTVLFGQTRTFANMSSIHGFYAARLTRTYLGASNEKRLEAEKPQQVTNTVPGDDYPGQSYWDWPGSAAATKGKNPTRSFAVGGPLHIVNTTINETFDVRTGLQNQDRKGTALAVGPCGLSVGIRDHLIASGQGVRIEPSSDKDRVFSAGDGTGTPDPLSLGRWISISGAAFSAAAGANTSVPIAILAGLFNVRLGYWWDSGTRYGDGWFERVLPVQAALFAETFARTRGTAGRLWNLSDGGHFENMGGYELIRRRLPIVVIVDAEADPDYTFEGLADLIRMARLDFDAEITFLSQEQLSGEHQIGSNRKVPLPQGLRPYFGDLEALRRGKWTNNQVPYPPAPDNRAFAIEVDRDRVSRAHAALARVKYLDNDDATWLVYVKATLMGDEPVDVSQYHRAHPAFPQEPTADQFFDERQWESYRRLGLHVGDRVLTTELFNFLEGNPA